MGAYSGRAGYGSFWHILAAHTTDLVVSSIKHLTFLIGVYIIKQVRGIAQLVARDIWDVEAGSSSLPTPTIILAESRGFASTFGQFLCVFKYYDATFGKSIFLRPLIKCGLWKILFFDSCVSNFDIIKRDVTEATSHNNDRNAKTMYYFLASSERSLLATLVSFKLHGHIIWA